MIVFTTTCAPRVVRAALSCTEREGGSLSERATIPQFPAKTRRGPLGFERSASCKSL